MENIEGEEKKLQKKRSIGDYKLGKKIGEGGYSEVIVGLDKSSNKVYAIKIIKKALLHKLNKTDTVFRERNIMCLLRDHSFFIKIFYSFQDTHNLYFVLSYARRGELFRYINKLHGLDTEATQFYTSEIVSALEYMHSKNIIHRDIKPENILIKENYHILITDFGTSKILKCDDGSNLNEKRNSSFVGTAQFVSPELLLDKKICKSSDLWSMGVTIYQMVTSKWPFFSLTEYYIFEKIRRMEYEFPENFPDITKDLVEKLLKANPYERLGDENCGGYPALKGHDFFKGVDWSQLFQREPPLQFKNCSLEMLPTITS